MLLINLMIFAIALTLVLKSSNSLVKSSSNLAKFLGVSQFVIGLTVVAIGTSIPELATSIIAALKKNSEIITGTIIGSNIANIGLILGIASVLMPIEIRKKKFSLESIFLVLISLIFFILSLDQKIIWTEGILFLFLFFIYIYFLIKKTNKETESKEEKNIIHNKSLIKTIFIIIISMACLYIGAVYLVKSASGIARFFRVSDEIIALTLIAVGTSLPELFVTFSAARQHKVSLLMGNIIGSNISNILLIGGISSLISPIFLNNFNIFIIIPLMITVSMLLYSFIKATWFSRVLEGIFFLFFYVLFIIFLILFAH